MSRDQTDGAAQYVRLSGLTRAQTCLTHHGNRPSAHDGFTIAHLLCLPLCQPGKADVLTVRVRWKDCYFAGEVPCLGFVRGCKSTLRACSTARTWLPCGLVIYSSAKAVIWRCPMTILDWSHCPAVE